MAVEVLVCGMADRGDDGAPIAAARLIALCLPSDVDLRVVGTLDVDALLAIPPRCGKVILDAAVGIEPGVIELIPLNGLIGRQDLRMRSSHALAFPEVLGLAGMMRGWPLSGVIVAIGVSRFAPGKPLSKRVAPALPALVRATLEAVDLARPPILLWDGDGWVHACGPVDPLETDLRLLVD